MVAKYIVPMYITAELIAYWFLVIMCCAVEFNKVVLC